MTDWSTEPYMVWKLVLYKEDTYGNQKFYKTNEDFDHSTIAEINYEDNEVTEIKDPED